MQGTIDPNLFDFATKELSQDAFLRWLFESHLSKDSIVKKCSQHLLHKLCGTNSRRKIEKLDTYSQVNKVDIVVDFICAKERHLLLIEDKVGSNEHDEQLKRYKSPESLKEIRKHAYFKHESSSWGEISDSNIHYVYFKAGHCTTEEQKTINQAKWEKFDLDEL